MLFTKPYSYPSQFFILLHFTIGLFLLVTLIMCLWYFFFRCLSQVVCWYFDIDDGEIPAGIDQIDSFVQTD